MHAEQLGLHHRGSAVHQNRLDPRRHLRRSEGLETNGGRANVMGIELSAAVRPLLDDGFSPVCALVATGWTSPIQLVATVVLVDGRGTLPVDVALTTKLGEMTKTGPVTKLMCTELDATPHATRQPQGAHGPAAHKALQLD